MATIASPPRRARPALSAVLAVSLAANGAVAPLAFASAPAAEIRVATGPGFSRLDLRGEGAIRRDGGAVVVRFAGAGPNLARLHVDPPPFLKGVDIKAVGGGAEVRLTPAEGAEILIGHADGGAFVNLRPTPDKPAAPATGAAAARADPAPAGGVKMTAAFKAGVLTLRFPWKAPVGAAVFRRGDGVWVVFDAKARLDLAAAPHGLPQAKGFAPIDGADFTALRIVSPESAAVSAHAEGSAWIVTLGALAATPPPVSVSRDEDGSAALIARTPGATGVFWVVDPVVGDRLAVVTASAPSGAPSARSFVDARLLASAQGLALQPTSDDVAVALEGERVRIGRPRGLALSQPSAGSAAPAQEQALDLPKPANLPGLIDFAAWSKTGEGGFLRRYDSLLTAASDETAKGKTAGVEARMGLARFLVGTELAEEAIGVLDTLAKVQPAVTATAEFRGLRGAARVMARRWKDAEADYSAPAISDDPAAALWRGYVAAREGDAAAAKAQFALGRVALESVDPLWRARFAAAAADAAIQTQDLDGARRFLAAAGEAKTPEDRAEQTMIHARLAEADGHADQALALYEGLANDAYGAVAAPALLKATELKLASGKLPLNDAIATLDSIRFRWRGDATELQVVRELGQVNLREGRYREALEAWRSAGQRMADLPAAAEIRADLAQAFKDLFLGGRADGLEPVQALALFYDFKGYAPVGADGDLMVRRLVRRLVDVDLLGPAAEFLKYQVDNRLDGPAKAQVATDLALVYLMDRKPEEALGAINGTRSTLLPTALNAQRRLLEARALVELGRNEHALEVLGADASPEATELRALSAWRARDWPSAAKLSEARLGERWKRPDPLTPAEASLLVRTGVALSLSNDDVGLARLRDHYAKAVDTSPNPEALRVALAGLNTVAGPGLIGAVSDGDAFAGWVARMKARFRDPTPAQAPPPRQQAQAAASGKAKQG